MSVKSRIEEKLKRRFSRKACSVVDKSHLHAGHAGSRPGGETHFRVTIVSSAFAGKSRVERHRMVNAVLAEELAGPVHALAVHRLRRARAEAEPYFGAAAGCSARGDRGADL